MRLLNTKHEEFLQVGVPNLSTSATTKAVTKEELARHCRRTRGMEEMKQLIEELLLSMSHATDTLVYSSSERRPRGAAEACSVSPGSSRYLPLHHHRLPPKRRYLFTSVALCSRHHFIGVLPPPSGKIHPWQFSW